MFRCLFSFGGYRPLLAAVVLAFSMLTLQGCSPLIQVDAIQDTVRPVVERHDNYTQTDESLSEEAKQQALAQSASVINLIDTNTEVSSAELAADLEPVMDRHDTYVRLDEELVALEKDTFLRSTEILTNILREAERQNE